MGLREKLGEDMKAAMKAREARKLATVRLMIAGIQTLENASATGKVSEEEMQGALLKMIRQRRESAEAFDKGGRPEQAAAEREEIAIIETYLPKQMSTDETRTVVAAIVQELGAAGPKDMGRVMAALKERFAGRLDFGAASVLVKELLTKA